MGEISLNDLRVARVAFVSRVEVYKRRNAHALSVYAPWHVCATGFNRSEKEAGVCSWRRAVPSLRSFTWLTPMIFTLKILF